VSTLRHTAILGIVSFLALAGCQQAPPPAPIPGVMARTGTVLKTVNGKAITQDMLDTMIKQLPEQLRAQLEANGQINQLDDQLVVQELLYQKAITSKLYEDPEVKQALAITTRSALADAMLRKDIEAQVTDATISKWYDDHAVQFARPQIQLAHIMVSTEKEAKAIRAQLDSGADFAALAKAKSLDPRTSGDGGLLGWVRPKDVGPLGDAVKDLDKGGIAGPVKSPQAWHILKVLDKRDKVPLKEVKDKITDQVKKELAEKYIDDLKASATITDGAGGAQVAVPSAPPAPAAKNAVVAPPPAAPNAGTNPQGK